MNSQELLLIAEDDPAQTKLYSIVIKEAYPAQAFTVFPDGIKLLEYLENEANKLPRLIILDSNLPVINGLETTKKIKSNPRLMHIPVIMFSASEHPDFYTQCYEAGVNSCLLKPVIYDGIVDIFRCTINFWMHTNRLPL